MHDPNAGGSDVVSNQNRPTQDFDFGSARSSMGAEHLTDPKITTEQHDKARLTVAAHAHDAGDCEFLLDILGLGYRKGIDHEGEI